MDRKRLHHHLNLLKAVKYWYLLVAFGISLTVFVFSYRGNNLTAIHLRDDLLNVDKENGDVDKALNELRAYTYGRMNANLGVANSGIYPPIQLKYRYERLVKAEQARVDAVNSKLYTEAQNYCEQQVTSRKTIERVPCINEYLSTHVGATVRNIPDALYKFDFASPVWSPDLAGFSLISTLVLLLALIVRLIIGLWVKP